MQIILASGSPRRKEILTEAGIIFEVRVSDCPEDTTETVPSGYVEELSLRKAMAIADAIKTEMGGKAMPEAILVIGADTVVANNNCILGKPDSVEAARGMIAALQGRDHSVFTGVSLIGINADKEIFVKETFSEETRVFVKPMTEQEIQDYVDIGESMDKAGAYAIQGEFGKHIDHFEGSYANVVGFPIERFLEYYEKIK